MSVECGLAIPSSTWVCTESPRQPSDKSYGADLHDDADTCTLLSTHSHCTDLGHPLLALMCVTPTRTMHIELGTGSKMPKQVPALVTYLGRQLKYKVVCNWHSQTELIRIQTNATFLEGNLSLCPKSLKTACVLWSNVLTNLLYRNNAVYNNENWK